LHKKAESSPKLMKDTKPQIQESQKTTTRINTKGKKKITPRRIIFKLWKTNNRENVARNQRERTVYHN
jgi:hypothetical protein